jgi:hypothetical protein
MKKAPNLLNRIHFLTFLCCLGIVIQSCETKQPHSEKIELFKKELSNLSEASDNALFVINVESILQVINSEKSITDEETLLLERMYDSFLNDSLANPSDIESYYQRKRTMILAYVSPTDSVVSIAWLRLPKNWDAEKEYPVYVHLHGGWDVADKPISFMSYTFIENPSTTRAFEDGYFLSPWARGNDWYKGISKTDVWESITELEKIAKVDSKRKYLCGYSMGGYGTWNIAQESADTWAAIGIHSGWLSGYFWWNTSYVTPECANSLKNTPTYFVWGDEETSVKKYNMEAYDLLEKAGNENLKIATFKGGHDYNESDLERMYDWMKTFEKE